MLIPCPECNIQISDKAVFCPHCGYVLNKQKFNSFRPKKRKRLPNGFGQISLIKSHNLAKPYRARVTVGKTDSGKLIVKPLQPDSYFKTYNEAYEALIKYNKNPYNIADTITFSLLYEKWSEEKYQTISDSRARNYKAIYKKCESLYDKKFNSIRTQDLKRCYESAELTYSTKNIMISLFNQLFEYAIDLQITDQNYAKLLNIKESKEDKENINKPKHFALTTEEIELLLANRNIKYVDLLLVQLYTGFRPGELLDIKISNIDLDKKIIVGGLKTKAGIDRTVPIHSKILSIVKEHYNPNNEYLFTNSKGQQISYWAYANRYFPSVLNKLNINLEHRPHDLRKTFITLAKKYEMDEYILKRIIGHSIEDITERIYTERDIEQYHKEIEKIR